MINLEQFDEEIKKGKIEKGYVFCGLDEELIKESMNSIIKRTINKDFEDLNLIKIDGLTATFQEIENACETISFFGDKKVVLVYRANFLKDKSDSAGTKMFKEILEYAKDIPDGTILIMYYIFNDKRETPKKNSKLLKLDKLVKVVHCDKLKKDKYYKKIEEVFKSKGRNIGKVELIYFAEKVQNNFDIIKREVDKLDAYALNREITKDDMNKIMASKSEDDIFDLVEYISVRKIEKALDLLNELLFKADQHMLIITSIQNHFKRLYEFKVYILKGKRVDFFMSKYRLPQFVCEKIITQSKKFDIKQLKEFTRICVETEKKLKSSTTDKQMEMELMLFKIFMTK